MDYRNLSIAEKIEQVQEYQPCGAEKKHQAAYLNALQTSNITQIAGCTKPLATAPAKSL
jgi:hypothetical protein